MSTKDVIQPEIILATQNKHKAEEFAAMLGGRFRVLTMADLGIYDEIIEDGETIEENADIKVEHLAYRLKDKLKSNMLLMADDTGLFVDALGGDPGVYSARYAGENCTYEDNNRKLLEALENVPEEERSAHFSTSLAIITPEDQHFNVTSYIKGSIATEPKGEDGFGYDPVFIENKTGKTYAQMSPEEKNRYSHRSAALEDAMVFIKSWIESE